MDSFRPPATDELTPVPLVIDRLRESCLKLPVVSVATVDAMGLVLALDARAVTAVPPFDNSAMDGFAFRASDLSGDVTDLVLRAMHEAGRDFALEELPLANCDAIMTGAAIPVGADTVVPFERVALHDDLVRISEQVLVGSFVRRAGSDVATGDLVLRAGITLTPQALAGLVACGVEEVRVVQQPKVAVLSTGSEVVGGAIPDSNAVYLQNALRSNGFLPVLLPAVDDDADALRLALRLAIADCDAVITTGGVGPGVRDLLPSVAESLGPVQRYSIAMKPGKPFAFGMLGGKVPLFALPGNPVSAMVSFNVVVLPALFAMAGRSPVSLSQGFAGESFGRQSDGKTHVVPAVLSADGIATPLPGGSSHMVASAAGADCLVMLPDGEGCSAGEAVSYLPLG